MGQIQINADNIRNYIVLHLSDYFKSTIMFKSINHF